MTSLPPVPVADPGAAYRARKAAIDAAVFRVLGSGRYILGPEVEAFEARFGAACGARGAVGVGSGTDALELALRALGAGDGAEVIVPSLAPSACAAAVRRAGACPVLADVDDASMTLHPGSAEEAVSGRTRAVMAVHLYGQPCRMDDLLDLARRKDLFLVEDGSQAHGASWGERPVGGIGAAGAFSFYPTKNLGALGDGGALVSTDGALLERARRLREYGWNVRHVSACDGINSRLDEVQAAVLLVRLEGLEADNRQRRAIAAAYTEALGACPVRGPSGDRGTCHVYHQYVIRTARRDDARRYLGERGVGTAVLYPRALHEQAAFADARRSATGLRAAEQATRELLCLPIYPEMTAAEVERVCGALAELSRALS